MIRIMTTMITSILLCWLIVNHSQDLFMGKGRLNTLHTYNLFASLSIVVNHQSLSSSLSSSSLSSAPSHLVIIPNQSQINILCTFTLSDFNWGRGNIVECPTATNLFCKDTFLKMCLIFCKDIRLMYLLYSARTSFGKCIC